MSSSWRNFDWWFHRSTGKRILHNKRGTEHALVVLVIPVIEVRNRWAGAIHAGPAHIRREETTRTSIDAPSGGTVGIGNGIRWAHRHASPGRIISESTKSAVVGAGDREIVGPTVLRASVDTEVRGVVRKGKLGPIGDNYVIKAVLQAEASVIVSIGGHRTSVHAGVGEIIAIERRIRRTLGHAFHGARVSVGMVEERSIRVGDVGT